MATGGDVVGFGSLLVRGGQVGEALGSLDGYGVPLRDRKGGGAGRGGFR